MVRMCLAHFAGLTVNTFKFMINHEYEPFMLGMSGTNCYKTNGNNILNCSYDHFLLIKHLKALLFVMELTFDTRAYLSALFHFFKSSFAPCADTHNANYRAGCREKVDNFNPT